MPDTKSEPVRVVINRNAVPRDAGYTAACERALPAADFDAARAEIATWPGYAPTPLVSLPGLAREFGLAELQYKEERHRFGLNSFKALGGAYAVMRVLAKELAKRGVKEPITSADLAGGRWREMTRDITIASATDGNHGRSVAWGAQLFGCRCVIFVHAGVSEARGAAIAAYGAQVIRVGGGYDDSVRHTFEEAARNGWFVAQDTGTPDYEDVPRDITSGYAVIAREVLAQVERPPTHVFAQAGVGGLASALLAQFWMRLPERPLFIVLEPTRADCVYQSITAGQRTDVHITDETVMAGLSCGEVSTLAWPILRDGAAAAMAIDDQFAIDGMRRFARPLAGDPAIVAGECSGGALGALLALKDRPNLQKTLQLDAQSRVLLIGTEGDTDPAIFKHAVGMTADEVLAGNGARL
jgi:diaminopropionate ammonia-lyase